MKKEAWGCVTCLLQFPGARPTHFLALPSSTGPRGSTFLVPPLLMGGGALSRRVGTPRGVGQTCISWVSIELTRVPTAIVSLSCLPIAAIFGLRIHSQASPTTSVAVVGIKTAR